MRIMGIDPGIAIVGYSVLENNEAGYNLITSGSIQTDKNKRESQRLFEIHEDLNSIIKKYKPDCSAVESLFYCKNQKTVMAVSQARGVILNALEMNNIPIFEYTPIVVKQVVTGFGRAKKDEVQKMVEMIMGNQKLPRLDDTVDSIAIAICHMRQSY